MNRKSAADAPRTDELWGHPKGLPVLISLKVWELFSYQGMRAFLVFYLIGAFGMRDDEAVLIFGSYAALVLSTSVLGGYCADKWLGAKRAMAIGAALIMSGHAALALENLLAGLQVANHAVTFQVFCMGLALIAVGTGLLKPNVLTMIGRLYRTDDPKREFGYYGYYIGVNIGSFAAPLICGGLASHYGWTWGFGAAAIGMALGLVSFVIGRRWVQPIDASPPQTAQVATRPLVAAALLIAVIAAATLLVQHGLAVGILLVCTLAVGVAVLLGRARASGEPGDTRLILRFFLLLPMPMFFEMLFEQLSTTVNLFSDRTVQQSLLGIAVTAPQLLSLNSFFVLTLLPFLTMTWRALARRGSDPGTFAKFAIGFTLMAAAFAILALSTSVGSSDTRISQLWIVGAYLVITLGELCIAPPAFAAVGRLVPERYAGVAMGLTLLSFAAGTFVASLLAGMAHVPETHSVPAARDAYGSFFVLPVMLALVFALIAAAFGRVLRSERSLSIGVGEAAG